MMDMYFIIFLAIIVFWASLVHGSIGFGFGMISTPLIALLTDMQTTIIVMLIPTMIVNIISIVNEGEFFQAIRKFWLMISLMIAGSIIGTFLLLYINSEYFKLLLALIIFLYLLQSSTKMKYHFIVKYEKISTYFVGILGGTISGLTNIVAPLMIIYSMELNYSRKDTIQLSNLCFLFTKIGQISIFVFYGAFTIEFLKISF